MKNKIKDLVVHSKAYLSDSLQNYAENIFFCESCQENITTTKEDYSGSLPYEVKIEDPKDEDLQLVIKFMRDTTGSLSISNNDIKNIALVVHLERMKNQNKIDHLNLAAFSSKLMNFVPSSIESDKLDEKNNFNDSNVQFSKPKCDVIELCDLLSEIASHNTDLECEKLKKDSQIELNEDKNENEDNKDEYKKKDKDENKSDEEFCNLFTEINDEFEKEEKNDINGPESWEIIDIGRMEEKFDPLEADKKSKLNTSQVSTAVLTIDNNSLENFLIQIGIIVLTVEDDMLIKKSNQFKEKLAICCFLCATTFAKFAELELHLSTNHQLTHYFKFSCDLCDFKTTNQSKLNVHKDEIHYSINFADSHF